MMTLAQLNYFCTACRLKSITKAAEQLYVTQPAITSAIRELEKEYQMVLLERKGRAISLTEEGKTFYKSAEALLEHARDLDRQLHDLAQQKRYVRLGLTKSVGSNTYTQYFAYGLRFHPQIDVATHSGSSAELLEELRGHRLDVILIPSITVPMIANEKMISTCQDENKVHALKKLFARYGYPDGPNVVQRFEQLSTALSLIRQNAGTGYFPEEGIQGYDGIVGKQLAGDEDIFVYAVTTKDSSRKEEVKAFLKGITGFYKNAEAREMFQV